MENAPASPDGTERCGGERSTAVPEAFVAPLSPLLPLEHTETEDRASHDARGKHAESEEISSQPEHHSSEGHDYESHSDGHESETLHADHIPADLSEEEVTALTEHIADAQDDAAARVAQDRILPRQTLLQTLRALLRTPKQRQKKSTPPRKKPKMK